MGLTYRQQTWLLFVGILAVLVIASIVGWVLKRYVAHRAPHPVIDNLNGRIASWWVMVAVISLAFVMGKGAVIVLFAFASFFALREFVTITYTRRGDHWALALGFFVVLPLQYYLIWAGRFGFAATLIPVYAFLFLPIVAALRQDPTRFLERTSTLQWGLMISVFCISHVPALLTLPIPGHEDRELLLIAFLVLVVQGSDILQYLWGQLFGKVQIAPQLAPGTTAEGLFGGILSATALGAVLSWMTPFTFWQAALMSFGICVMGFWGRIVMSAVKRDRGVKDFGHMIEGQGGMLDRLDSVCFAAPVFFHVTRFGWSA